MEFKVQIDLDLNDLKAFLEKNYRKSLKSAENNEEKNGKVTEEYYAEWYGIYALEYRVKAEIYQYFLNIVEEYLEYGANEENIQYFIQTLMRSLGQIELPNQGSMYSRDLTSQWKADVYKDIITYIFYDVNASKA